MSKQPDKKASIQAIPFIRLAWLYVGVLACTFLALLGAVATINFIVDPYQYFRKSERPQFSRLMMRHQIPGVIRNYPFDAAIVGHSLVANLLPEYFTAYKPPISVQNLSLYGATLHETTEVVKLAIREKKTKLFFWGVGYQDTKNDYRISDFPNCMFSAWQKNLPLCYLINADVLKESIPDLLNFRILTRENWEPNIRRWQNYGDHPLDSHQHACEIQKVAGSISNVKNLTDRALNAMEPFPTPNAVRFGDLVFPIVDGNPDVKFVFFFPPVLITTFWQQAVTSSTVPEFQYMKQELSKRSNVDVFDFQMHHGLTPLAMFYNDPYHGNSGVAARVGPALTEGKFRFQSLEQNKAELQRAISDAVPYVIKAFDQKCS